MISMKKKGYDDADIAIVNMILVIEKCSIADISQALFLFCMVSGRGAACSTYAWFSL